MRIVHIRGVITTATCIAITLLLALAVNAARGESLKPAGIVPLEGLFGQVGQMAADATENRLYVLAQCDIRRPPVIIARGDCVIVVDTKRNRDLGVVTTSIADPHGIIFLPELGRLIIANSSNLNIYADDPRR